MRYMAILLVLIAKVALADAFTIGPDGIDSKATGLDGSTTDADSPGIEIGQIESGRSGKPNYGIPPEPAASNTNPAGVYFKTTAGMANPDEAEGSHATRVAGVMIGDASIALFEGVAPKANLHSAALGSGINDQLPADIDVDFALTANRLARLSGAGVRMRAINVSAGRSLQTPFEDTNGNSHLTLFIDWSARQQDILYAIAWGNSDSPPKRSPTDNFNGMTVAASQQVDPESGDTAYRKFGSVNAVLGQPSGFRTAISLLAPGQTISILGPGDIGEIDDGTSFAAPHVTATVALLQQYAKPKVDDGTDPRWGTNSQKHEVMKAVMMNSADKLAGVHGSTRDVLDINGQDWLQSAAFTDPRTPLDPWTGTGHLNARRSVRATAS